MMKTCVLLFAMSFLTLAAARPDLSSADDAKSKQEAIDADMSCERHKDTITNQTYIVFIMTGHEFLEYDEFMENFYKICYGGDDSENSPNRTKSSGDENDAPTLKNEPSKYPSLASLGKIITETLSEIWTSVINFFTPADKTSIITEESDVGKQVWIKGRRLD